MTTIDWLADSIRGLQEAVDSLRADAPTSAQLDAIIDRGDFRPSEDEAIGFWFARFLTVREELWAVIDEVLAVLDKPLDAVREQEDLRYFLVGYAATCLLIRLDRVMLFEVAHHSTIQRKLNEAFPDFQLQYDLFSGAVELLDHFHRYMPQDCLTGERFLRLKTLKQKLRANDVPEYFHVAEKPFEPAHRV